MSKIVTNTEYRVRLVMKGLEKPKEQFAISSNATVRVRIISESGNVAWTNWVTLSHNANRDDNWMLGVLDVIIPASETLKVDAKTAQVEVNIAGAYVDKDGTDLTDTYDERWYFDQPVQEGLA